MKLFSWLFICLKLLLLVTALSARRCVKPNPTTALPPVTTPTDRPSTTSSEPIPTDNPTQEPSTAIPDSSTALPTEQTSSSTDDAPTELPTESTSDSVTEVSSIATTIHGTATPSGATVSSPGATEVATTDRPATDPTTEEPTSAAPTSTTVEIPIDPNTMCKNHPEVEFLPHPYNCHKYIQCAGLIGYIRECPANLFWDSKLNTCGATCA